MALPRRSSVLGEHSAMKIYEEIGSGSFGKVYRAYDPALSRIVAVKMIQLDTSGDLTNFLLELRFLRELKCDYITQVLSSALHDSVLWVSMEYCGAGSCTHLMRRFGTFTERATLYVMHEALMGLAYIHEQRKIHRDLKSANILVTEQAEVKIADFGVSAQLSDQMPQRDTFMGTPYWMAPEVIIGDKYGTAVDIWSLGIVAIELMTGAPPLRKYQPNEVIQMIQSRPSPQLPPTCRCTATFRHFVSLCVQKRPYERPSAQQLLKSSVFAGFSNSSRYIPRPPEFTSMVNKAVRLRKAASQQNPIGTRTAADIEHLAPARTFHSRDHFVPQQTNSSSTADTSDWEFTADNDASLDSMPKCTRHGMPPQLFVDSGEQSPDSNDPQVTPPSLSAAAPGLPHGVSLKREPRKLDSISPPPPPIPARKRQRMKKTHSPLWKPRKNASLRHSERGSPLSQKDANKSSQRRKAGPGPGAKSSAIPIAVPKKVEHLVFPPRPRLQASPLFNDVIKPALLETEKRSRWDVAVQAIEDLSCTFEKVDKELPGFTGAFLEELREARNKAAQAKHAAKQSAKQSANQAPIHGAYKPSQAALFFGLPANKVSARAGSHPRNPVHKLRDNARDGHAKESHI